MNEQEHATEMAWDHGDEASRWGIFRPHWEWTTTCAKVASWHWPQRLCSCCRASTTRPARRVGSDESMGWSRLYRSAWDAQCWSRSSELTIGPSRVSGLQQV